MYRLSIIPYFFIYIFVIIAADQIKIPNLKYVFYFGFFINLVFIFNAHLSSRMSRVVEPLLMMGLYFALGKFKTKLNAQLRFVISLLPGLAFYGLDRNLISCRNGFLPKQIKLVEFHEEKCCLNIWSVITLSCCVVRIVEYNQVM